MSPRPAGLRRWPIACEGIFILCPECFAVITSEHEDDHQQWHNQINRATEDISQ